MILTMKIKEIQVILEDINDMTDVRLQQFMRDERLTVRKLVEKHQKKLIKKQHLYEAFQQSLYYEQQAKLQGYQSIVGIDEVGRGPLAGPVVAAAVILADDCYIEGLTDSKKLTSKKRQKLFKMIQQQSLAIGIGIVEPQIIDEINILEATKVAMYQALEQVQQSINVDYLLIDALTLPKITLPQVPLIKGDVKSASIAAASIIAKQTRDELMCQYAKQYPQYGFEQHSGYGTKQHLACIQQYGICEIHRLTFEPIKSKFQKKYKKQ